MLHDIRRCVRDEWGAEIIEWVILGVLLTVAVMAIFGPGSPAKTIFENGIEWIASHISHAP
jgi:Flp pilus assembly pilin Flp